MARLFVEQLTVIDCSYLHPLRGLVGESWIVDLELAGTLDSQSMVVDFGTIKRRIKQVIDQTADHKLIVPGHYPRLDLAGQDEVLRLEFIDQAGRRLEHHSPAAALCLLEAAEVEENTLERHLLEHVRSVVPDNVSQIEITLHTEATAGPCYQYSHGLKKHDGACQRIAHGHRSRLEVYENGVRSNRWERYFTERWRDIYLASAEDEVAAASGRRRFAYRAREGDFLLEMEPERCYVMPTDTTMECIAQHIAAELKRLQGNSRFLVKAFEGLNKGAIAEA